MNTDQVVAVTGKNFALKVVGFSCVLLLADTLVPNLYPTLWSIFWTVMTLAVMGSIGDLVIVPRLGNALSLTLGYPGIVFVIWFVAGNWHPGHVSLWVAAVLGLCIAPIEFWLHRYVLRALYGYAS